MTARGKREAKRSASPLDHNHNHCEALKERNNVTMLSRTFSALSILFLPTRGNALRSAQRLPLAIIFRAFGAPQT